METKTTMDTEIPSLNQDCVEHLFQFIPPKEWPAFMQVCKLWKLAANRFLNFSFVLLKDSSAGRGWGGPILGFVSNNESLNEQGRESISFAEFKNILKFIVPQLRYANIQISRLPWHDAIVRLGHFEYIIKTNFGRREMHELMNIIAKQAKNIKTLKIDTFDGATKEDWENFFRVNPVTTFKFTIRTPQDRRSFFTSYVPILPNHVERVCIDCQYFIVTKNANTKNYLIVERVVLTQFLDRLPRITKLKLVNVSPTNLAKVLSKHVGWMTHLCLNNCFNRLKGSTILSVIPHCSNLTNLKLEFDFTLQDVLCTQIKDNCQSIRRLSLFPWDKLLQKYAISEKSLETLLSLPNLEELHIYPTKITLTTEAKQLKKLFFKRKQNLSVDFNNLADALALMPCLSSLTLDGLKNSVSASAARRIKQTILSRGQNIVFYTEHTAYRSVGKVHDIIKVAEIPCKKQPLKGEFAFFGVDRSTAEWWSYWMF